MTRAATLALLAACNPVVADAPLPADAPPATRPPLPALAEAVDHDPDPSIVEVHLEAAEATVDLRDGDATRVLAYREVDRPATIPGPHIVARVGDTLLVRFTNRMTERTTTVHWHGLRLPEAMDGNPARSGAVDPGESVEIRFPLRDAGLFWYHPHVDPDEQIELGLHGTLLVRAADEPEVDVERVLVLDDIDLDDDAQVDLEADQGDLALGRHGDTILVNGRERPDLLVGADTTERWRIVNAANGRHFALELPGHTFIVIGGDGGPLAAPASQDTLVVAPGERHDVLVEITADPGERLWLRSAAVARGHGDVPGFDVLELRVAAREDPPRSVDPGAFTAAFTPLPVTAATPVRSFRLGEDLEADGGPRFTINDELWPYNTPIHATLGALEVWSLDNDGPGDHPFHLHGAFFQVLGADGRPDPRLGWKDTVRIGAHTTLRLAVRHETPGMWMYHCQIPEHAEGGMMGDLMVAP